MASSNDFSILHLSRKAKALDRSQVFVEFSPEWNRKLLPEIETVIEDEWISRLAGNPKLYDSKKFRLYSVKTSGDDVYFKLGLTSYKEFLGTNCQSQAQWLQEKGKADFEDNSVYLANPLGVGSLILTSDNQFVFMRRSSFCAEGAGLIDRPGGHPEPDHMCEVNNQNMENLSNVPPALFTDELFDSVLREIVDEINIPRSELSDPVLFGLVYNNNTAGRASAEFLVRCFLPAVKIKALYNKGDQREADESTELIFITERVFATLSTDQTHIWNQLTPASHGCITMFHEHRNNLKKDSLTKEDLDFIRSNFELKSEMSEHDVGEN